MSDKSSNVFVWKEPLYLWVILAVMAVMLSYIYYDGIEWMVTTWSGKQEYGYGFIIPLITLFFIWSNKDKLEKIEFNGSWFGVLMLVAGIFMFMLGELSTIYVIIEYSLVVVLAALVLSYMGFKGFGLIWVPLFLLFFMVPLPDFIYEGLSTKLQLISSELGVAFIRLFDISVYLEGNVIDLGTYRLQVVEACSGLRYLFPLAALAFIAAYIFKAPLWKRVVVFLSCVPITIFMNSFRIGVIGILVDSWGISHAEGFLHYFEGWFIFMACMFILILEIVLLSKIGPSKSTFSNAFSIDFPEPSPHGAAAVKRKMPLTFITSFFLLAATIPLGATLDKRQDLVPDRNEFSGFPGEIGGWISNKGRLEQIYIDALKLDDHLLADFRNEANEYVNLYIAYYDSQSKGGSAHSPRTCIPGGGWQMKDISQRTLADVYVDGLPLSVNRIEIRKGEYRQLVYYWFQGRNRIITNEYLVKWFIFWDSLTRSRTDGALVRLTAYVAPDDNIDDIDYRLTLFAGDVSSYLSNYIPN